MTENGRIPASLRAMTFLLNVGPPRSWGASEWLHRGAMACLPQSGRCERERTDAFVNHLNVSEGRRYVHEQCLDVAIRDRPQPETLYRDDSDQSHVVIERKNVLWPLDYAQRHHADHILFDLLMERLGPATRSGPYALTYSGNVSLNHRALREFADTLAHDVMPWIGKLSPGQGITSSVGQHRYRFWLQWSADRDEADPPNGLMIELVQKPSSEIDDPKNLPPDLQTAIETCFRSCARKFADYQHARRILLLDQYGEMRYLDESWWHEVLIRIPPPDTISEIWLGIHDLVTETEEAWMFTKLHPTEGAG